MRIRSTFLVLAVSCAPLVAAAQHFDRTGAHVAAKGVHGFETFTGGLLGMVLMIGALGLGPNAEGFVAPGLRPPVAARQGPRGELP